MEIISLKGDRLMIKELNTTNFVDTIESQDKLVLIDFWASWCGPCSMMSKRLEELDSEIQDKIIIGKVNIDDEWLLSESYNVKSVPTLMVFYKGQLVDELVGLASKERLKESLNRYLQ